MDDYESEIARQPRGPFSRAPERQLIRRVAEHWSAGQRYSAERRRRWSRYGWWIGVAAPVILALYKLAEGVIAKGS